MVHGLSTVVAGIKDHAIALGQPFGSCDLGGCGEHVSEQRGMLLTGFGQRGDVFTRDNQDVNRRLRMDVSKGVALVILVNGGRGDAPVNDFAKKTTHGAISLQEYALMEACPI